MTEASLAIARKVVLCAGLLVSALLFLYPHWRLSIDVRVNGGPTVNQDLGRAFISSTPLADPASVAHIYVSAAVGIHYVRQFTEVAIALLFTFGLMSALKLKKPAGDLSGTVRSRAGKSKDGRG
jgi:hypothetical protein